MKSRGRALALVLAAAGCARAHPGPAPATPSGARPNLIFIVTDDMSVEDLAHLPRVSAL
jgi:hypothetical protein